jgi:hypothetical protein
MIDDGMIDDGPTVDGRTRAAVSGSAFGETNWGEVRRTEGAVSGGSPVLLARTGDLAAPFLHHARFDAV